jgi:hypothetical protein
MRNAIATILVVGVVWSAASGCSTKPPRDVDAAVRQRLTRYSEAWKQGDAAGVRESFVPRDADEAALLDAISQLAAAQVKLRTAYYGQLGPIGRTIFGDGDVSKLTSPSTRWDSYARDAAHPYNLTYKKPYVLVQLAENDKGTIVPARNVGGGVWKLELGGFIGGGGGGGGGRDVSELTQATLVEVRQTDEMTAAVRSGDFKEIQRVMLKHIGETPMRGPMRQAVQDVLGDGATTRSATTTMPVSAKENPP